MGGGNTIRISRLWYALLLLSMGTVNLGLAAGDAFPNIGAAMWGRFIIGSIVGSYFYGCAVFHFCGWVRTKWRDFT